MNGKRQEFSAERAGIAWVATPPDDTCSDYGKYFYVDSDTGVLLKENLYPRGMVTPWHRHTHAHGMYVLDGMLRTNKGIYGPGSFVWWPAGTVAEHGAVDTEDVRVYFMTAGAFDLLYEEGEDQKKEETGLREYVVDANAIPWQKKSDPEGGIFYEKVLLEDEKTDMYISLRMLPAKWELDWHTAEGAYGYYVLKGIMKSDKGFYGPGSFIWYQKGCVARQGASKYTDAEAIFVSVGKTGYKKASDPSNWTRA